MTFLRFNLLVVRLTGWLMQQQNNIINFLMEEDRTLHDLFGKQRLGSTISNADVWPPKPSPSPEKSWSASVRS